jgi:AcrR family transcriptional regulator
MNQSAAFKNVLGVFAHYGFRKASMDELARAAGVSRQTLYNRFKTKEAVLDWAVEGFISETRERASAELKSSDASLATRLLNAFSRWTGDHVAILHDAPHGAEIIDMGTESLKRANADPHADFEREVAQFLKDRGVCRTRKEAEDKAYLLHMSSKGLFMKSRTTDEFQVGMARIIDAAM